MTSYNFRHLQRAVYRRWATEKTDFDWTCENCSTDMAPEAAFHISLASFDKNNNDEPPLVHETKYK
jgi:hypothetical protein